MRLFIFLTMIFCHILDDYVLQGWLANGKQKDWWKKVAPDKMYKYDYIMALFMHSFSWSFMIMLPIAVYLKLRLTPIFLTLFVGNIITHGIIDNLKANLKKINLIQDQLIHIVQIILTFICILIL